MLITFRIYSWICSVSRQIPLVVLIQFFCRIVGIVLNLIQISRIITGLITILHVLIINFCRIFSLILWILNLCLIFVIHIYGWVSGIRFSLLITFRIFCWICGISRQIPLVVLIQAFCRIGGIVLNLIQISRIITRVIAILHVLIINIRRIFSLILWTLNLCLIFFIYIYCWVSAVRFCLLITFRIDSWICGISRQIFIVILIQAFCSIGGIVLNLIQISRIITRVIAILHI